MDQMNPQAPTVDERGYEAHPAWGLIGAYRVSSGGGPHNGRTLFDSDIPHSSYVVLRVHRAKRQRTLNRDWIGEDSRQTIVEVAMSEAQWASLVSSMNTSGVPCTIERTEQDGAMPAFPYKPRLGESVAEVRAAGEKALADIAAAQRAVAEAFERSAGKKEMRSLLATLAAMVENGPGNMAFAAKSLTEHTENVVQRARADVEAMVQRHADAVGLDSLHGAGLALPLTLIEDSGPDAA